MLLNYFIFCLFVFVVFIKPVLKYIFLLNKIIFKIYVLINLVYKVMDPFDTCSYLCDLNFIFLLFPFLPTTHVKQYNLEKTECIFPWFYSF